MKPELQQRRGRKRKRCATISRLGRQIGAFHSAITKAQEHAEKKRETRIAAERKKKKKEVHDLIKARKAN